MPPPIRGGGTTMLFAADDEFRNTETQLRTIIRPRVLRSVTYFNVALT